MKQKSMHSFIIFWDSCIFFLILILERSFGADPHYEACGPRDCGNGLKISFPFYIQGVQESFCGYPGFEMNCSSHGYPIIHIPDNDYVVEQIFYHNRTFRVYNAAVAHFSNSTNCIPQIRSVKLPNYQFVYAGESSILYLLSNCTEILPEQLLNYEVAACDGQNRDGLELAMLGNDENLSSALDECDTDVVAPVEYGGSSGMIDYIGLLRRGFVLNWEASDCNRCEQSGGRCGFDSTSYHFKCYCPDRPHVWTCKSGKNERRLIVLVTAIGGSAFLLMIVLVSFLIWRRKKHTKNASYYLSRNTSSTKPDLECGSVYFGIPVFSYTELEEVTNKFDTSKELGDGGFGTVYYGKLRDGREVAVKRLYGHNLKRMEQFMNEVKILTRFRHRNLMSLYGCTSRRSRELLLVYEYIPNGTVADHLHASDIIHRDVKTSNILLDHNFGVKVADFGLSRLFPNDASHVSTAPQGTPGYVDPEYHQCYQLTDRSDVYSFGVVLIELISSMPAVDIGSHRHEINLANLAINRIQKCAFNELIDPSLGFESDPEVMRMTTSVAELAFWCLQLEKEMMPTMDEALETLKQIQNYRDNSGCMTKETNENAIEFDSRTAKIPPSPESEDVLLLKKNTKVPPSPNSPHQWVSSSYANSISR